MTGQRLFLGDMYDLTGAGRRPARERWPWPNTLRLRIKSGLPPFGQSKTSWPRLIRHVDDHCCASPAFALSSRPGELTDFFGGVALSSKPPYASSLRSVLADSVSCTTGCAENTRSAAASEASMPARSFVVGDGVRIDHRWRAARQADHACTIAKTRAANIAASSRCWPLHRRGATT